ncbi:MAG: OmpH family outer membrane protein [Rhodospirillales bacterium]|nr:OmpH family outer membrane protein [Rhodospirillales bacterium]
MRGGRERLGLCFLSIWLIFLSPSTASGQEISGPPSDGSPTGGVVINLPPNPGLPVNGGIIVVDVQRILEASLAVRAVQAQLTEARQAFQQETRAREAALRERDRQLAAERGRLEESVFQRERDRLATDLASLQEDIRVWFRAHDRTMNQTMHQAQQALLHIVSDLARQRGAAVVISKSSVVLVQPGLDVTDAALQRLDQQLPNLPAPQLPTVLAPSKNLR